MRPYRQAFLNQKVVELTSDIVGAYPAVHLSLLLRIIEKVRVYDNVLSIILCITKPRLALEVVDLLGNGLFLEGSARRGYIYVKIEPKKLCLVFLITRVPYDVLAVKLGELF